MPEKEEKKLNNESEPKNEDEVVKAITEEYEAKLKKQEDDFKVRLENALKEQEEHHIKQIRALMSGHEESKKEEPKEELSDEEEILNKVRKKFNLI